MRRPVAWVVGSFSVIAIGCVTPPPAGGRRSSPSRPAHATVASQPEGHGLPPGWRARVPRATADLNNVLDFGLDGHDAICMRKPNQGVVCAVPDRASDVVYPVAVSEAEAGFALGPMGVCIFNAARPSIDCTHPREMGTSFVSGSTWPRLASLEHASLESFRGTWNGYCARWNGKRGCEGPRGPIALSEALEGEPDDVPIAISADRVCSAIGAARELRCFSIGVPGASLAMPSVTKVREIVAGASHVCAMTEGGRVHCFGANDHAQLGHLREAASEVPGLVSLPAPAIHLAAGEVHTCAVLKGGATYCWGSAEEGASTGKLDGGQKLRTCRLVRVEKVTTTRPCPPRPGARPNDEPRHHPSDGPRDCPETHENPIYDTETPCVYPREPEVRVQPTPTPISGLPKATAIAAGRARTCIVDEAGSLHCFGGTPIRFPEARDGGKP